MRVGVLVVGLTVLALGLAATATGGPSAPAAIPGCAKASLNLVEDGQLSLATDNPAFDPWWRRLQVEGLGDQRPDDGQGLRVGGRLRGREAARLHEGAGHVEAVPFLKSFAPGKKSFDFYIAQVSNKPERRKAVTFSASYYVVNQAVAALKSNPISQGPLTRRPRRSTASERSVGTTSYDYIVRYIKPDQAPRVYDSVNDASRR